MSGRRRDVWRPPASGGRSGDVLERTAARPPAPPAGGARRHASTPPPRNRRPRRLTVLVAVLVVVVLGSGGFVAWRVLGADDDAPVATGPRRVATGGDSCKPVYAERTADCPFSKHFDPSVFAKDHGASTYPCRYFASQADAQAVLRANPADPNHLSRDGDGVACRGGFAPNDFTPVAAAVTPCSATSQRTARCPQATTFDPVHFVGTTEGVAYRCSDLATQADAQAVLRAAPTDPDGLDPDRSGVACPDLPAPRDTTAVVRR